MLVFRRQRQIYLTWMTFPNPSDFPWTISKRRLHSSAFMCVMGLYVSTFEKLLMVFQKFWPQRARIREFCADHALRSTLHWLQSIMPQKSLNPYLWYLNILKRPWEWWRTCILNAGCQESAKQTMGSRSLVCHGHAVHSQCNPKTIWSGWNVARSKVGQRSLIPRMV